MHDICFELGKALAAEALEQAPDQPMEWIRHRIKDAAQLALDHATISVGRMQAGEIPVVRRVLQ